jgi:hypothetical protein
MENPGTAMRGVAGPHKVPGWVDAVNEVRETALSLRADALLQSPIFGRDCQNQSQNVAFPRISKAPRGHYDDRRALKHDRKIVHS